MSKTVVASKHVAAQVAASFDETESVNFFYGLVIGQVINDAKELLVVHLARTPVEDQEDEDSGMPVMKMDEVEAGWLSEHAKQVLSMLPGGLHIQGLFVASEVFSDKASLTKLKSCLAAVRKLNDSKRPLVVMQLDLRSQSVRCESFEADSNKAKSLAYEESAEDLKWLCVKANFILDNPLAFTKDQTEWPLKHKLETAVQRLKKALEDAVFLIDGHYRGDDELLDPSVGVASPFGKAKKGKKGKRAQKEETTTTSGEEGGQHGEETFMKHKSKEFDVDILFGDDGRADDDNCNISEVSSKMRIIGRMSTRAYVSNKAKVGEALEALRTDVIRTLMARLEMHCDSLVGDEMLGTGAEMPVMHEPPRRVNICLPGSSITVSDFLFPGESPEESVKAVEEMFGFTPTFEHLDDELEIVASPQTVMMADDSESRAESPVLETRTTQSQCTPFHIVLSVVVALIGIGASYLLTVNGGTTESISQDPDHAPNTDGS